MIIQSIKILDTNENFTNWEVDARLGDQWIQFEVCEGPTVWAAAMGIMGKLFYHSENKKETLFYNYLNRAAVKLIDESNAYIDQCAEKME